MIESLNTSSLNTFQDQTHTRIRAHSQCLLMGMAHTVCVAILQVSPVARNVPAKHRQLSARTLLNLLPSQSALLGRLDAPLCESFEALEGVVDEDPILVAGLRVLLARGHRRGTGDLKVNVGELVEV